MILNAGGHRAVAVLRVSTGVLDLPGVVITDQNAASDYRLFLPSPQGLAKVDREAVFAEHWTHSENRAAEWRHKSMKCAEVLVPDAVHPRFITGIYVSCNETRGWLLSIIDNVPIIVDGQLFFV